MELGSRADQEQSRTKRNENQSQMLKFDWTSNLIGLNQSTTNVLNAELISCRRLILYNVHSGCAPPGLGVAATPVSYL